jgi:hypothetical protein
MHNLAMSLRVDIDATAGVSGWFEWIYDREGIAVTRALRREASTVLHIYNSFVTVELVNVKVEELID